MTRGIFITFEGGDGSGKTTQINILREYLENKGYVVLLTREPGGTPVSEKIRELILDTANSDMDSMAEAMLYAAARAQLVNQFIRPALEEGRIVICDRFVDSSIAYQAYGRQLGDSVENINSYAVGDCMPDLTILLKVAPETGNERISGREKDRIESAPSDFHERVYQGYLELEKANPERIIGIDAGNSIEEIAAVIAAKVDEFIDG